MTTPPHFKGDVVLKGDGVEQRSKDAFIQL
jgi:hypothetical protein